MSRAEQDEPQRPPEDSPTVASRWLANDLRELRVAAGLKQADVARELGCASTKIGHIESQHSPVRRADLLVMLPLYGVPRERVVWYLDLAEKAQQKGWWDGDPGIPRWFSAYVGLEWGASEIHAYDLGCIPGLLQTPEYAAEVIRADIGGSKESIQEIVNQRMRRQDVLNRPERPLKLHSIIDEAPLHRLVGGRTVMQEQLEHLAKMTQHPQVTVQAVPFSKGAHPGQPGTFSWLGFPSPKDPGVVYLETRRGGLYMEQDAEITEFRSAFDKLTNVALDPDESAAMIKDLARNLQ